MRELSRKIYTIPIFVLRHGPRPALYRTGKEILMDIATKCQTHNTERQKGVWLKDTKNFGGSIVTAWHCSICGAVHEKPSTTDHYCYFCGSKMDGERSE